MAKPVKGATKSYRAERIVLFATPIVVVAGLATAAYLALWRGPSAKPAAGNPRVLARPVVTKAPANPVPKGRSVDGLIGMSPAQLAGVDIAEMNLLCAAGLPGAEKLDIGRCLARLDEWAAKVKYETERHLYRAQDPKWAEHYKHSESWLRAEFLAQVLQEVCGVHYNMERVRKVDFTKSEDLFIHGMIDDTNGGTCASMPVLYVAVGRRLGYPLKLVPTKAHLFVRWDDGKERFNIETTSNGAADSFPDDHYRTWPEKWSPAEGMAHRYLIPLPPAGELASFLGSRGHCLLDNGRVEEAFATYAAARKLAPWDAAYASWMRCAEAALRPPAYAAGPQGTRAPADARKTHDPLADAARIDAMNQANLRGQTPQPPHAARPPTPLGPQSQQPAVPQPFSPYRPPVPAEPPRP